MSCPFLDDLHRALFSTLATADTFLIVDVGDTIIHMDRVGLTLFLAELAGDAAGGADFFDRDAAILVGTAHCIW